MASFAGLLWPPFKLTEEPGIDRLDVAIDIAELGRESATEEAESASECVLGNEEGCCLTEKTNVLLIANRAHCGCMT